MKPVIWCGSSREDLLDDRVFNTDARKQAGQELRNVQYGQNPTDWKPFDEVGAGTKEIRIKVSTNDYRILYVAKFEEAIYVLHCFKKTSQKTTQHDKGIARSRYKSVINSRGLE